MSTLLTWSTAAVVVAFLADSILIRRRSHHRTDVKRPRGWLQYWGNATIGLFAVLCAAVLSLQVGTLHLGAPGPLLQALGLVLAIGATVVIARAGVELGESFAADVRSWAEQQLVVRGLFALVRHPIYLGTTVLWLGAGLGLLNWILLAVAAAVIAPTFYLLAAWEEELLEERFGQSYRDYRARVPMLLPWPRPTTAPRRDAATRGQGNTEREHPIRDALDAQDPQDARVEEI